MSSKKTMKKMYENKMLNKEQNYEQIMIKLKKKNRMKFCRYALVPTCAVLIIGIIVMVQYSFNTKFSDSNKTENNNDNQIKDPNYNNIPKEKIYMIMGGSEKGWAFNVFDTSIIFDSADYVVKLTVLDIGKGTFDYSEGSYLPTTPISVKVLKTFKGSNNNNIDTIIQHGGYVTARQVLNVSPKDRNEKLGLNKLNENEKDELYMYFEANPTYNFQIGETYVVALSKGNNDYYYISANGFSIFKNDNSNKPNIYSNVVTGNILNLDNLN